MLRYALFLLLLTPFARAEEPVCRDSFAKLTSYDVHRQASVERSKAMAEFIASGAGKLRDHAREIWVEDYLGAWRSGKNIPEKSWQFLKRALLAPRSRAKDPSLREAELKKFHALIFAMDPVIDGSVEVTSKAKQLFGFAPIQRRLSIPASIVAGVATYGAIFVGLGELKKSAIHDAAADGALGADALEEWSKLGQIDPEELVKQANAHARLLVKWMENSGSDKRDRPIPPRFLQFRAEGLLKGDNETNAFEDLLFDILEENHKRRERKLTPVGDKFVKAEILKRLAAHPLFQGKSEGERALLSIVFDPPILLGGKSQSMAWFDELRRGETTNYNKLRPHTDIAALKASLSLRAVEDVFGTEASPLKAAFVYSQGMEENQKLIAAKRARWAESASLPPEKAYLAERTDLPFNVEPTLTWVKLDGTKKEIGTEIELLELLSSHPSLINLKKSWLEGALSDQSAFTQVRQMAAELSVLQAWQAEKLKKNRAARPDRETPLDPIPQEVCMLKKENHFFQQLVARESSPICSYMQGVYAWRWVAANEIAHRDGKAGESYETSQEKARNACAASDAREKLAKAFRIEASEVDAALVCQ